MRMSSRLCALSSQFFTQLELCLRPTPSSQSSSHLADRLTSTDPLALLEITARTSAVFSLPLRGDHPYRFEVRALCTV
ncbi:hypothetical protein B0H14DRAFT_3887006 [Mycena olivaceomarginata]|nr:hypothetical protein B0H14DRAFT_3887006 [Mycena olivaceomarginata]